MKIIAHRANIDGPNENENSPQSIQNAILAGFDVEVDVWCVDGSIFAGHDYPKYKLDKDFLISIKELSWFHCKNLEAMEYFIDMNDGFNFFWHDSDDYTLTSLGYIWAYPGNNLSSNSINVLPEKSGLEPDTCFGICTDFPSRYLQLHN